MAALLTTYSSDYSRDMDETHPDTAAEEAAWIRQAQRADALAFEKLYRLHVDKVYGLCLRMTGNVSEAEDCTQDAFIQAWHKLTKFRGDSAFSTWLHRVAVNAVLGRMRKDKRDRDRVDAAAKLAAPARAASDDGELRDLAAAIERLPEGARHVFVLYAVYGYSHAEAGEMLGIATGTSKAQLHRARKLLMDELQPQGFTK